MSALVKQVNTEDVPLTVESLKGVMPKRQKHNINKALVDELNLIVTDPEERDHFRENLLGYTNVLQDPNVRLPTYIEAVKYVSFKLMGYTNQESWIKTFPDRYARLLKDGKDEGFLRATVSCYNRGKVVNMILEQTLVPTYVLNQDLYQKALNVQAQLMMTADSEKVRTEAANSLLVNLKQPETTKLDISVGVKEDDSLRELRDATMELIEEQKKAIRAGVNSAQDIAESKIIVGEAKRVDT
jgi:hypothetical protein